AVHVLCSHCSPLVSGCNVSSELHTFFYSHGKCLKFCSLAVGFLDHGLKWSELMIDNKCFLAPLVHHTTCERDVGLFLGQLGQSLHDLLLSCEYGCSFFLYFVLLLELKHLLFKFCIVLGGNRGPVF